MKRPTKINFDVDDNGNTGGSDGGGSDDGGVLPIPGRPRSPRPAPRPEKDSYDELMNRYNKLRSSKYYPTRPPRPLPRLPSYWKATGRVSDISGHVTAPPTPIRDDYFPPPPVDLADDSFILPDVQTKPPVPPKPVITKPKIAPKPVLDSFSRPLTKIIDSKKNKIQIIPKKTESEDIDDINLSERLSKLFPEINQVTEEKMDHEKS